MASCPGVALPETAVKALIEAEFSEYSGDVYSWPPNGTARVNDILLEIVRHESGFNPLCVGDAGEVGLFQIHPVNFAQFNTNAMALREPSVNAHVAHLLFDKAGETSSGGMAFQAAFSPWTTFAEALTTVGDAPLVGNTHEGGLYPGQLQVEDTIGAVLSGVVGTVQDAYNAAKAAFGILKWLMNPDNWIRIGLVALGVFVIIVAIVIYNREKIAPAATMLATKGMAK